MNPPSWRGLKTGRTSTTALSSPLMSSGETALEFEAPTRGLAGSLVSRSLIYDILLASAANAVNQADRNIMPIAVIPMAEEFDWSMMQRGLILSSFAYGYILTQLPGGFEVVVRILNSLDLLLLEGRECLTPRRQLILGRPLYHPPAAPVLAAAVDVGADR